MSYPLDTHFDTVFPNDRNRNAAGAQWFHYIETNSLNQNLHKAYCGVSGSVVDPSKPPATVRVPTASGGYMCGEYHLCCHPCACDVMRFTHAEKWNDKTVLTIPDPCARPQSIPKEVTSFRCSKGKTENAIHTPTGRIAIAVLHNPRVCHEPVHRESLCEHRNSTPVEKLSGGMGDLFARVASVTPSR